MTKSIKKRIKEADINIKKLEELASRWKECEKSLNDLKDRFYLERFNAANQIGRKKK